MLNKSIFLSAIFFMACAEDREEGEFRSSSALLTMLGNSYIELLENSTADMAANTAVDPFDGKDNQKRDKKFLFRLNVKEQNPKDKSIGSANHGDIS